MSESELYGQIMLAHSRGYSRLWRQNAGLAWAGKVVNQTPRSITLSPFHPIRLGMTGLSDLGGLTAVRITPDMVGQLIACYLAVECKFGRNKATPEQAAFIELVRSLGGRAGIARSVEDAAHIIAGV